MSAKPIMWIAVAKVQQNLRICKKNRILVRFFTRRVIAEHKTSGGYWESGLARRESVERRIGGMVRGKYWMVMHW